MSVPAGVLAPQPECPVCGGVERRPRPLDYHANNYLAVAARALGVTQEALFAAMPAHECAACAAIYFDPWLSVELQERFYGELFPQHNLGWYTFWNVLRAPAPAARDLALLAELRRHVPRLGTYAEVGCPFLGLLPALGVRRYEANGRAFHDYPGAYPVARPAGKYPQVRGNRLLNLERVGAAVARAAASAQVARALGPARLAERRAVRAGRAGRGEGSDIRACYLRLDSGMLWGRECRSLGVECRAALTSVFGIPGLALEDAEAARKRFDVVAVINALDHYRNPVALLRRLFSLTDHVYLEGHHADGERGKQHLYFLEAETLDGLEKLEPSIERVPGFTGRAQPHWYSLLLRRRR